MTRLHRIVVAVLLTGLPLWAAEERVVFEDRFDGKLGEGWSWLRENPPAWKIAEGALEIRVEPGDAQSVKNALVRNAPDRRKGKTAIEVTVIFNTPPTNQYEQAGITWYRGNQPVFKLVHERVDGKLYIVPGKVPAEMKTVTLRLIVTADKYTAQFRPDAKGEFKTVAEGDLAAGADEKVSLQCYQGPPDAEHWIRFDDFRVVQLAEGAAEAQEGFKSLFDDKTLVAWVSPADLTQRGGSVLTLIDKGEHFDAIVLGEVAQGTWMAGSDFFRRTHKDQGGWPVETANRQTLVQLAITYRGDRVTVFRNGREYAAYRIVQPQSFGGDAMVLLGLRYIGGMGEIGFFTGAIEDARIYDVALKAEQIAALVPNRLSDPKPLAWWTFEDGRADDVMKTFPAYRLEGDARIAGGKLVLDGSGYLWAARNANLLVTDEEEPVPFDATVQTMFYKARSKQTGNMWDTWLYLHEGIYYLYYLAKPRDPWDNVSMATSPDGVHWKEIGRVLSMGRGVTWMGTGSTWKSPHFEKDGKFFMNFSEWKGPRQTIFFAESKDLVHWTRLGNEYEFVQDERWYEKNGRWDCIWTIPRPGGGYYGYWTATPKAETGGQFGFGESLDGITWKALAPPKVTGAGKGEVGAIEKIGGRYYMMFGTGGTMVTLVAERPEGPFRAARKNFCLLAGHTYFSRFFPTPDGVLVNHHSIARDGQVYFGSLKATVIDDEGTLRLTWWKGNEKMKHHAVEAKVPPGREAPSALTMFENGFDTSAGLILEGTLKLPAAKDSQPVGLFISQDEGAGMAILVHASGVTEFGPMRSEGAGFHAEHRVDREWRFGPTVRFRLLLKGSLLEFYLDDLLMQCYSLGHTASGKIGLLSGGDASAFANLKAWRSEASKETGK